MPRLQQAIQLYIQILLAFAIHRLLSWPFLISGFEQVHNNDLPMFLVGMMSDNWIALAIAVVYLLASLPLDDKKSQYTLIGFLCLFTLLTALHQAYTEFFHFQLIPFHITYLSDRDFMKANFSSAFTWRAGIICLTAVGAYQGVKRSKVLSGTIPHLKGVAIGLLLAAGVLRAFNIFYRVQLFIPENLQMNYYEKLFADVTKTKIPPRLTHQQWMLLASKLAPQETAKLGPKAPDVQLSKAIFAHPVPKSGIPPVFELIRKNVAIAESRGEKPVVITVLAESLRASETGGWGDSSRVSLTPNIDQLVDAGIGFRNAYSTGTVTRGAQEAIMCGYLGSMNTSLMRNRPDVHINCLPELTNSIQRPSGRVANFWFHGGEGRFDGQLSFWSKRGIGSLLSYRDFPSTAPQTDWGYSDLALVAASIQKIVALRSRKDVGLIYGMILTVTNHIPWRLPSDTPTHITNKAWYLAHESFRTTAYTDHAVGDLVKQLRESQIWSKTILVVTGDHGNLIRTYRKSPLKWNTKEELQSRVPLVLSGGIVEAAVRDSVKKLSPGWESSHWNSSFVSQADVAPLLSYFMGVDSGRFIGEMPSDLPRVTPVSSDLGTSVYFPGLSLTISDRELIDPRIQTMTTTRDLAVLYYRAFLEFLHHTQDLPQ